MKQALQLLQMEAACGMDGDDLHAAIRNEKLLSKQTKKQLFCALLVKLNVRVDGEEERLTRKQKQLVQKQVQALLAHDKVAAEVSLELDEDPAVVMDAIKAQCTKGIVSAIAFEVVTRARLIRGLLSGMIAARTSQVEYNQEILGLSNTLKHFSSGESLLLSRKDGKSYLDRVCPDPNTWTQTVRRNAQGRIISVGLHVNIKDLLDYLVNFPGWRNSLAIHSDCPSNLTKAEWLGLVQGWTEDNPPLTYSKLSRWMPQVLHWGLRLGVTVFGRLLALVERLDSDGASTSFLQQIQAAVRQDGIACFRVRSKSKVCKVIRAVLGKLFSVIYVLSLEDTSHKHWGWLMLDSTDVGQGLVALFGPQVATPTLHECLVHGADCFHGVSDIEAVLGLHGCLSLKHLAKFGFEEAHLLRCFDLKLTSRGGAAKKRNRIASRARKHKLDGEVAMLYAADDGHWDSQSARQGALAQGTLAFFGSSVRRRNLVHQLCGAQSQPQVYGKTPCRQRICRQRSHWRLQKCVCARHLLCHLREGIFCSPCRLRVRVRACVCV